jgi:hypothetical protein
VYTPHPFARSTTAAQRRDSGPRRSGSCLAAASLHIHVQSFGRFDEIWYLVEKTSALALRISGETPFDPVATSCRNLRSTATILATPTLETSSLGASAPSRLPASAPDFQ